MTHHTGPAWAIYDALFSHAPVRQHPPAPPAEVPPLTFHAPHPGGSRDEDLNERKYR